MTCKVTEYRALVQHYCRQIDKERIAELPPYEEHGREVILVADHNLDHAVHDLMQQRHLGFDTESKPTFKKGEVSSGIAIMQLSSATRCYIFQMNRISDATRLGEIIGQPQIIKIGVGLGNDLSTLRGKHTLAPAAFVDVGRIFRAFGRRNSLGSKQLVALVLDKHLRKSKRVTTSNWAAATLSPMQIKYASDDAFSSIDAYLKLREVFAGYTAQLDRNVVKLLDL